MTKNYGKVGWKDNSNKTNNFATLENGSNLVRFISDIYKYFVHKEKYPGDSAKFGRPIKCAIDDCPLCKDGSEAKPKYIGGVLINGQVKFLDMGPGLYNEISGLTYNMKGFEDPQDYYVNIVKNPKGGATGFYKAYPAEKTPLTAKQMAQIETEFNEEELEKFIQPPKPEDILKQIERIKSWISKSNNQENSNDDRNVKESNVKVSEDDYDFTVKRS